MGYCTAYTLEARLQCPANAPMQTLLGEPEPDFVEWLKSNSTHLDGYDPFEEPCKWYPHEDDMKKLSIAFPAHFFILRGTGEDHQREGGDMWVKHFFQGKVHVARAKITFQDPPVSFFF